MQDTNVFDWGAQKVRAPGNVFFVAAQIETEPVRGAFVVGLQCFELVSKLVRNCLGPSDPTAQSVAAERPNQPRH